MSEYTDEELIDRIHRVESVGDVIIIADILGIRLEARNREIAELKARAVDYAETLVELNSEGLISLEILECVEMEEFIRSVAK